MLLTVRLSHSTRSWSLAKARKLRWGRLTLKALRSREESSRPKGKKVIIFKYKAKKDYRKKQGHRQPYTLVEITSIAGKAAPAAAAKEEAPVEEKKAVKKPSLKSMKKAELIEFAKENNIEINEKATNAVMIETIEAALK